MGLVCGEMSGRNGFEKGGSVFLWRMKCPDLGSFVRQALLHSSRLETTPSSPDHHQKLSTFNTYGNRIRKERIKEKFFFLIRIIFEKSR